MYEYTDRIIEVLEKYFIRQFSRLKSLLPMDELNVMASVDAVYAECMIYIRKLFLRLARREYTAARREASLQSLDEEWLDALLEGYDPVMKYVFAHEIDRRASRLAEAIIASDTKESEVDAALRALSLMCRGFAVRVTDEAILQAYRDDGGIFVRWIAEKDLRTCTVCRKRDGMVYEIAHLPPKPHFNCRCRYERVS